MPYHLKDSNGVEIQLGAKAVLLNPSMESLRGKIGTVENFSPGLAWRDNKPGVLVAEGPLEDRQWASWALPEEITVVEAPRP